MGRPLVLSIDPGYAAVGYAIVQLRAIGEQVLAMGVIRTQKSQAKQKILASSDERRRGQEITQMLVTLIGEAKDDVELICLEAASYPRNASTARKLGIFQGVICALSVMMRGSILPTPEASPQEIKKRLCGSRDASKEAVKEALERRYGDLSAHLAQVPASLHGHAYDALGAVVACEFSEAMLMARRMAA